MTPTYTDIDCVICFSDKYTNKNVNLELSLYTTKCGHKFHRKCLKTWCYTNNSCPNCRTLDVMIISSSQNSNPPSLNSDTIINNYHYSNTYTVSQESTDNTSNAEGNPADFNNIDNSLRYYQSPSNLRPNTPRRLRNNDQPNIIQYNINESIANINLNNVNRLRNIRPPFRHRNRVTPHSNIMNNIWNDNRYSADQNHEASGSDEDNNTINTFNNLNNLNNRNYRNNFPWRNDNIYNQTTFYDVAQEIYHNAALNDQD